MPNAIKGIIFDFGGVFTSTAPRDKVLRRCEVELGLPRGRLLDVLFTGERWRAVSRGRISAEEYWRGVIDALGGRVPVALEPFKRNPFAYERLNRRMSALARRLHRRYSTALLSNATIYLDALLTEKRLDTHFDVIVNSARVGMRKPNPAIFALTLERLGLCAEECLLIDDKERNTGAAQTLGLQSVVFRSAADLGRQLTTLGMLGT